MVMTAVDTPRGKKITISRVTLNDKVLTKLASIVHEHPTVSCLVLDRCLYKEDVFNTFIRNLSGRAIGRIRLSNMGLSTTTLQHIATAIQEQLCHGLYLGDANLDDKGAAMIACALNDSGLREMFLPHNHVGPEGALSLSKVLLRGDTSLTHLVLDYNPIQDNGLLSLASALPSCRLAQIDLRSAGITYVGVKALCDALPQARTLRCLSLAGNALQDDSARAFANVLKHTSLTSARLDINDFTSDGVLAIADGIRQSCMIKRFCVTTPSDDVVFEFCERIKTHLSLERLAIDNQDTSDRAREYLRRVIANLHRERAKTMTVMCSALFAPRVGSRSLLRMLPVELMHSVADMLH
jgi:hypothetical protein